MTEFDIVFNYPFKKPLHRLIMMKILSSGSASGQGERLIEHDAFCAFCCCSKQALFLEANKLERLGVLRIRKIMMINEDGLPRVESFRGYQILPPESF